MPSYQAALDRFDGLQTQVLGLSVDSVPCLTAWAEHFGGFTYPLLSDFWPHGHVAECYGVLRRDGKSERALFVIDKKGIIRYVDVHDIEKQPDNDVLFGELAKLEPVLAAALPKPVVIEAPEPDADVVLYCTAWCPDCRRVRALFKEKGISYVEVDIQRDRNGAKRVRTWANGNETTPTVKIRGEVMVGYNRTKLEEAIKKIGVN